MSGNKNTQEHELVQAIELSDTEMEKISGGRYRRRRRRYGRRRRRRYYYY